MEFHVFAYFSVKLLKRLRIRVETKPKNKNRDTLVRVFSQVMPGYNRSNIEPFAVYADLVSVTTLLLVADSV